MIGLERKEEWRCSTAVGEEKVLLSSSSLPLSPRSGPKASPLLPPTHTNPGPVFSLRGSITRLPHTHSSFAKKREKKSLLQCLDLLLRQFIRPLKKKRESARSSNALFRQLRTSTQFSFLSQGCRVKRNALDPNFLYSVFLPSLFLPNCSPNEGK